MGLSERAGGGGLFGSGWVPLENLQILVLFTHARATEADYRRCSIKKVFLKISQNSPENASAKASFLANLQAFLKKETLVQFFQVNIEKFLKNTFFMEHLRWLLLEF